MGKRTPIGAFIHSTWSSMNIRAGKYKHFQTVEKCKSYEGISITFSREEYKEYCIEHEKHILSLERPSVDRINKDENYTLDNIQIIELSENIRKDKTIFKNGKGICSKCQEEKLEKFFAKDKRRSNGRSSICKKCDSKRKLKQNGKDS